MTDSAIASAGLPELKLKKGDSFISSVSKSTHTAAAEQSTAQAHEHKQSVCHTLIR